MVLLKNQKCILVTFEIYRHTPQKEKQATTTEVITMDSYIYAIRDIQTIEEMEEDEDE